MLTTPHLLIGAAIGAQLRSPILTVPVAGASHFLFDWVPHLMGIIEVEDLEKKDLVFVVGDIVLGVSILLLASQGNPHWEILWIGALAAVLPDFHHIVQVVLGPQRLERYTKVHMKFHYKKQMNVIIGMATQVFACVIAMWIIYINR